METEFRPHIYILIILLTAVIYVHVARSELQKGYRSYVIAFYKGKPYGLNQCLNLCLRNYLCQSFNFNRVQLTCELMELEANSLVKETGFTYGQKSDFPMDTPSTAAYTTMTSCFTTSRGNCSCVVTECPYPSKPSNTNSGGEPYPRQVGGSVTFTCNYNYLPIGDMTITCQPNGAWSENGHCQHQVCDIPRSSGLANVGGGGGSIYVGSTWTWVCRQGYSAVGQRTITCQSNLTWTSTNFSCV